MEKIFYDEQRYDIIINKILEQISSLYKQFNFVLNEEK